MLLSQRGVLSISHHFDMERSPPEVDLIANRAGNKPAGGNTVEILDRQVVLPSFLQRLQKLVEWLLGTDVR
jgi:hypothetical protein